MGYKVYVNGVLYYDGSSDSTTNEYTVTGLSVGIIYAVSVTAINAVGESALTTLSLLSASIPSKLLSPYL